MPTPRFIGHHHHRCGTVCRAAGQLALGLGAAWCAQAQAPPPTFTRTIDSLVEVRRSAPFFGHYSLLASESLRITRDGELNAPTQSTGATIHLLGDVLNEGRLRAGFGSEAMGLLVGGTLTNAGGNLLAPTGQIEAVQLSTFASAQLLNHGLMATGSHTVPGSPGGPAALRTAFQNQGIASADTGFAIAQGALIDNAPSGVWFSEAHGNVSGTLRNAGLFISQDAPATLPASPTGVGYLKLLRVGLDDTTSPIGLIDNQGQMVLDAQTALLNAGTVVNGVQLVSAGQIDVLRNGLLRNDPGAELRMGGRLTVSASAPYDRGLRNLGLLVLQNGGQLLNQNQVFNGFSGVVAVAAAVPGPNGGALQQAGSVLQSEVATLTNRGLLDLRGSFQGGTVDNEFAQVTLGPGAHLTVSTFFGGQVHNDGGHVEVGRDATFSADGITQTAGRLTINGTLEMTAGGTLRIQGGLLDGGGMRDPLTGTVAGGGLINGNVFLSGVGGGPAQQPPFCLATGWACFRPGNSPGAVQIHGDLTLGDHAVLQLELERDAAGVLHWDTVQATTMHFGAGSVIELTLGSGVDTAGLPLDLLRCDQACTFDGSFRVLGGTGEVVAGATGLRFNGVSAVPEPAPAALLLTGVLSFAWLRRRRPSPTP